MRISSARIAGWVMAQRKLIFVLFGVITLFFAAGLPRVKLETIFSDLLPQDDPFVQVFRDHPTFGNPLTVAVMVRRSDGGDLYNAESLAKVWQLTRDIDLVPGVDHDLILSISTERARTSEATPMGIDMRPLMDDHPPATPEELAIFRTRVDQAPKLREFLISRDDKSTIITATLLEKDTDYGVSFRAVQEIARKAQDPHHEIFVAGQPILIGWVYHYERQMIMIFGVTLIALTLALIVYLRSWVGVLTPIITSAVAAIWAFGLVGWLHISIEPLLMVVPLLLTARSFSHSVQFTERFYEIYATVGDRRAAAQQTMAVMASPSVLGIMTDVLGIIVVCAAPIPAMVRHAIFCGMWAVWLIPTGVILISVLLSVLPAPRNAAQFTRQRSDRPDPVRGVLGLLARLSHGRAAGLTTLAMLVFSGASIYLASQIKIGNPVEGSSLLWENSPFNTAIRAINANFPGVNSLEIVLESKKPSKDDWTMQQVDTVKTMEKLQRLLEADPRPPRATLSFADYLSESSRLFNGGHPDWSPLDPKQSAMSAAMIGALMGGSSKSYSHIVDSTLNHGTVSLWYPNNRQETVDAALASARKAVDVVGEDHPNFRVRLASGTIALQEAVNRVVERYHRVVVLAVNFFIFLLASFAYRSLVAGILLLIPVNIANEALIASMHLLGVGLDVNSMIVAAIGLGVGIDYGIYLLSRICEEVRANGGDWGAAIEAAIRTTGKAILFTATIMMLGILPWYLLSDLKFVADMGLLIIAIMGINMVLSLVLLPLLVWWVRPAFALRQGGPVVGH